MRRFAVLLLTALIALSTVPQVQAQPAVTAQEWRLMSAGNEAADAGDLETALANWTQLVPLLKTHNYDACGNYAQKTARTLDSLGRYQEALPWFETEFFCWGQFPDPAEWVLWDQRRVEQLTPRLQAYVSRPTAGLEKPGLAKFEPAFGALYAGTIDKDPAVFNDLNKATATYGKPYGMVMVYANVGGALPAATVGQAKRAGLPLNLAWHPVGGLNSVTEAVTLSFAKTLADYGHPILLRFGIEMNDTGNNWHGNPALYIEKFRLVSRIMRQTAPNVAIVWAPNFIGEDYNLYYPGDEWVDWVGVSAYHDAHFGADVNARQMLNDLYYQGKRANPLDKFKTFYETYSRRKPMMIAETGYNYSNRGGAENGLPFYDESAWAAQTMRYVYTYLPMLFPRIKAVGHFNTPNLSYYDYVISGNPTVLSAFRDAIAPDWYLSSLDQRPATYWHPMEQATLQGKTHVGAYVWLGDAGVSRVEYLVDGQVKATSRQLPYEADLDLTGLAGQHTITVRAYDKAGRLYTSRDYTFDASPIRVRLNGRYVDFDQPPITENGRTLVPMRAIMEALGITVNWEASSNTAVATKGNTTLRLQIDNPVPVRNGQRLPALDVPARMVGGRTLVPGRAVAESFEMDVQWDNETRTVIITSK